MKLSENARYFSTDNYNFPMIRSYFGPPSLLDIFYYCNELDEELKSSKSSIIHWSSYGNKKKYLNSVFLLGSFMLLQIRDTPENVYTFLMQNVIQIDIPKYMDTTSDYENTLDMIYFFRALYYANQFHWFSLDTFNPTLYEELEYFIGNINWILPGKFLALRDPAKYLLKYSSSFINVFRMCNVETIIRLNNRTYDKKIFIHNGFKFYDLYFDDNTVPSRQIVQRFMVIANHTRGAIAIHCRAGLGRTGTLIAAYMIRHYCSLSSLDATAWIRLCRPGSITGEQQQYLHLQENWLKRRCI